MRGRDWIARPRRVGTFLAALALLTAVHLAPVHAAEDRVQIAQVEVTGVTVFDAAQLESSLEIGAGDLLERRKVIRTAENIQSLYRLKGYEEVQVRSELLRQRNAAGKEETVLAFKVVEGLPTRIADIRLTPLTIKDPAFQRYWNTSAEAFESRTGISPGAILDQEQLGASRHALQEALASEEYVGARVADVVVEPMTSPAGEERQAARWVSVEFKLELGDRVTFGFRGNKAISRSQLAGVIDEQRLVGLGKDYVSAIKKKIEEEYRKLGYAQVQVTAYSFDRVDQHQRHITFEIIEGPILKIEAIDFDGNSIFATEILRTEFFARATPLVRRKIYIESDVEKTALLVVEWIKSQGYLAAKVVTITPVYNPSERSMRLVIYLYEGDQTVLRSFSAEGAKFIPEPEIAGILSLRVGHPLNLFAFNEALEVLKARYHSRGFLEMKIANEGTASVIHYDQDNRVADITLQIQEGTQFRVSRIELEGLGSTHEEVARREFQFAPGDVIEEARLTQTEERLRRLGVFSFVSTRLIDDPDTHDLKIVRVSLQEGTPGLIAGGIGYRNDLGIRLFGQYTYTNLWKRNHTLSFNANTNRRFDEKFCQNTQERTTDIKIGQTSCFLEYQVQLAYLWPWFGFPELTFRPKIAFDKTQYKKLDASTIALTTTFERNILPSPNLTGVLTYSLERIREFNASYLVDNQDQLTIGAIIPALRLDMRDRALAPTRGFFASTSYEVAAPWLLSQRNPFPIGYTRFQLRTDMLVPLAPEVTWFLSFRSGYERNTQTPPAGSPNDESYAIPLIKQFTLGGAGSVRGFQEQSINTAELAIRGTLSYVNYRTQLDLPFAGPMRFGPFIDAANLLVDRFSFGNLRYGTGVGFHYQSPVGPVNFDWGFNLFPRPGEDPFHFYFSIGQI